MMRVVLTMIHEGGQWRVEAPNGHYCECGTGNLSHTVEKVVKDYAEWLSKRVDLSHLEYTVTRNGVKETWIG